MQNSLSRQSNGFTAAQRIPRGEGYGRCLKAHAVSDDYFKLYFLNNHLNKARLGIVVAKRLTPNSVDRNKAKRKIRELFRIHPIRECCLDLVVMLRKSGHSNPELYEYHLNELFNRVTMRCKES